MVILFTHFKLITMPTKSPPVLNRIILSLFFVFLCDLMLHTLINKILNVNIIWSDTQLYYFGFTANMLQATSAWEYVASTKFLRNKSTPYHALNNYLLKACILYGINRKE